MFIYRLLRYVAIIADFSILIVIYYIWVGIKQKLSFSKWISLIKYENSNLLGHYSQIILIVVAIAMLNTNPAVHQLVGVNNLELKPEGTYCFYVEAMRDGGRTYTLPAQIRVENETHDVGEGKTRTYRHYYIERVFFSNGGYLDTVDTDSVDINESTSYYDGEDYWSLVLLNEHAYSPNVEETNNATWPEILFLIFKSACIGILLYSLVKKENE